MIAAAAVWLILSLAAPWVLSDQNRFLKDFVGSDLLSLLGVIVTITLASAASLHFELNRLEEAAGKCGFPRTRAAIRQSANWLIGLLLFALVLIVAKPLIGQGDVATSLVNGGALLIVLFNVLVLIDLTQIAFKIGPDLPN